MPSSRGTKDGQDAYKSLANQLQEALDELQDMEERTFKEPGGPQGQPISPQSLQTQPASSASPGSKRQQTSPIPTSSPDRPVSPQTPTHGRTSPNQQSSQTPRITKQPQDSAASTVRELEGSVRSKPPSSRGDLQDAQSQKTIQATKLPSESRRSSVYLGSRRPSSRPTSASDLDPSSVGGRGIRRLHSPQKQRSALSIPGQITRHYHHFNDTALWQGDQATPQAWREEIPDQLRKFVFCMPDNKALASLMADLERANMMRFGCRPETGPAATKCLLQRRRPTEQARAKSAGAVPRYRPTYRLHPKRTVDVDRVSRIMHSILLEGVGGLSYSPSWVPPAVQILASAIVQRVKALEYDRRKLAVAVSVMEMKHQGSALALGFLWDSDHERYAHATHFTPTFCIQATAFIVYKD